MSLYTVVGDPHAVPSNLEQIGTLFDILEDIGNNVIILGDLFDTKEIIRGRVFNFVNRRLRESKLNFIILAGNHDWFNLDCKEHSLETLKNLSNVRIVDKPMHLKNMLFLPYFDDVKEFKEALTGAPGFPKPQILFIHQGVSGFDYGNGFFADGNGSGELSSETIKGFKKVISGHFHKYQQKGNLTFLGTPFSHSFGESDQKKYIGLFDSETGDLELYETPFPRHITLEVDCSKPNPQKELENLIQLKDPKNYFRAKLKGTEIQIKSIDQSKFPDVKFIEEPTDMEQVTDVLVNDTDSNEQKFMTWAKEIKGLEDSVIKKGLALLNEVK